MVNAQKNTTTLVQQLKRYKLCKRCFERHAGNNSNRVAKGADRCYICRGLFDDLAPMADRIIGAARDYEYNTFLIGATLPTGIYEREDAMRARLKIRGIESAKNHLTRELGMRLAKTSGRKVDYLKPDIMVSITIDKENNVGVDVKSRPLALEGRYVKKARGLPQKQDRCPHCEGKGCGSCNHSGLSGYGSVEGVIAKGLMEATGGQAPKFSWVGSEDQSSLVSGKGRPFYVRVSDPKKRELKKLKVKGEGVEATMAVRDDSPDAQPRFTVKTKIHIRCERALEKPDLKKIGALAGTQISYENRAKKVTKKIHSAHVKKIDGSQFALTMVADGGLMIKQFVGGEEYMKPNISEILGCKCECVTFDILDVTLIQ